MKISKFFSRSWILVAVFSLAFSQVAMAASLCTMSAAQMSSAMAAMQMASAMADGGDCAGGDPATLHLCVKTCQDEPQKSDSPALAALPPLADEGLRVEALRTPALSPGVHREFLLARTTAPPPSILFVRFLK